MSRTVRLSFPELAPETASKLLRAIARIVNSQHSEVRTKLQMADGAQGDPVGILVFGAVAAVALAIKAIRGELSEWNEPDPTVEDISENPANFQ